MKTTHPVFFEIPQTSSYTLSITQCANLSMVKPSCLSDDVGCSLKYASLGTNLSHNFSKPCRFQYLDDTTFPKCVLVFHELCLHFGSDAKFIPKAIVFKGLSLNVSLRNAIFLILWCKNNKWSYSWSKNRKKPSFNQISVTTSHWVHFKKSTVLWSKHFHFWKVYIFCFDKVMLACSSNFWLSNFQIFRDYRHYKKDNKHLRM